MKTSKDLKAMAQQAMAFTKQVTEKWPDRLTGRKGCLECGDYLYDTISTFTDTSTKESFDIWPNAFLGYMRINCIFYVLALLAFFFGQYWLALILALLSLYTVISQSIYYWGHWDLFYKKMKGQNIIGSIEPSEEVKHQIIISAHHDSAHIFNFLENNARAYPKKLLSVILFQVGLLVLSLSFTLMSCFEYGAISFHHMAFAFLALGMIPMIIFWNFRNPNKGTPGAGDNMICTATAIEIGKHYAELKSNNQGLKHTRLIVASWDSEECGLRGARAYVKRHLNELKNTKTYNFNQECYYDHETMSILISDLNGLVPLSTDMANTIKGIGGELGYKLNLAKFPFFAGGTDSAEFAKEGIESICLNGMSMDGYGENPSYHTTRDTIDAVDIKAVEIAIDLGISYVEYMDKQVSEI